MEEILSCRYAKALLDLTIEEGVVDEAADDIRDMARLLKENPEFRKFLTSPLIDRAAKLEPVKRLMAGASELGRNFVLLLVQKGRLSVLDKILSDYERMADEILGRAIAHIETAGPIDDEKVEVIRKQLEKVTNSKIKVDIMANKALLAGVRARVRDRIYDGSLLKKVEEMRQVLAG